jgi:hypothetical protein
MRGCGEPQRENAVYRDQLARRFNFAIVQRRAATAVVCQVISLMDRGDWVVNDANQLGLRCAGCFEGVESLKEGFAQAEKPRRVFGKDGDSNFRRTKRGWKFESVRIYKQTHTHSRALFVDSRGIQLFRAV